MSLASSAKRLERESRCTSSDDTGSAGETDAPVPVAPPAEELMPELPANVAAHCCNISRWLTGSGEGSFRVGVCCPIDDEPAMPQPSDKRPKRASDSDGEIIMLALTD